jgi:spermidine dehydrogenase
MCHLVREVVNSGAGGFVQDSRDRELGLDRKITRRDFLNGVAVTAGASMAIGAAAFPRQLMAWQGETVGQESPKYYPPALNGLRGSHPGSFETAHSLRDGSFWVDAPKPTDTGEKYDLVVVGGGISGLAAAYFYRKAAGKNARILILDNHDDFGGHAKRNEFRVGDKTLECFGGTYSIESPLPYSDVAKGLIRELGIDVPSFSKYANEGMYHAQGLYPSIFFEKSTYGTDKLVINPAPHPGIESRDLKPGPDAWKKFLAEAPLSPEGKQAFQRLHEGKTDYLPGLTDAQKKDRLARVSYAQFLTEQVKVNEEVLHLIQEMPHPEYAAGPEAISALEAWDTGYSGFQGMNLTPTPGSEEADEFFFHFPDGNASIARLLVRQLIPAAVPGNSISDEVTARVNYAKLDDAASEVRIRLNSTVARVKHAGDVASAKEVEVTYVRNDIPYTVQAGHCVLACWHAVIPYINDEMPDKQREAMASAEKVPLLYTNVAIRNWTSFQKLGASWIYAPGCYYAHMNLDVPVSIGSYQFARKPEEPIVVHMVRTPCKPGLSLRKQYRAGRAELFMTSWETLERNTREQMGRILGPGGFDPARDIVAITANRWPHGYAYEYCPLWDKFLLEGGEKPCEVARKPYGRIAIANSDAQAYAFTDAAIDQAWRAVGEITGKG